VGGAAAAISIERYVTLTRLIISNRKAWNNVEPALTSGDFENARETTSNDQTALSRLLGVGLARQGRGAASRRCREGDASDHDGDHPATREAHALPGDFRQSRDAARSSRYLSAA
jgi:hypothetical protein